MLKKLTRKHSVIHKGLSQVHFHKMFHWVLNKDICEIWLVIFVDYDSSLGISVISWNWRQRTGGKELGTVHKNMAMAWKNHSVMAINVLELDPIQIVDFY